MSQSKPYISFSQFTDFNKCPYYYKLVHVDGIKLFKGNEFTTFGTAIHTVNEGKLIERELKGDKLTDWNEVFDKKFLSELQKLKKDDVRLNVDLIREMRDQGKNNIIPYVLPAMEKYFPEGYELAGSEMSLYEPIEYFETQKKFKGFIDLIVKASDGKHHLIDWKTCTYWDARKRSDKMTIYQLIFYKYFYSKKKDVNIDDIECHFGLLKRTAKKDSVELFKVTSGKKRIDNALNMLQNTIRNIEKGNFLKNKAKCEGCPFEHSGLCKR